MRAEELTIGVEAKVDVSRSTAEGCLKLVEIYMNDHRELCIRCDRNEDGTDSLSIVRKDEL